MQSSRDKLWEATVEHTVKMAIMSSVNANDDVYDKIDMDTDIIKTLNLDSLDAAEMIMKVEEVHGMDEIPEDTARKTVKLQDMCDYTKQHSSKTCDELMNDILTKGGADKSRFLSLVSKVFGIGVDLLESCATADDIIAALPNNE